MPAKVKPVAKLAKPTTFDECLARFTAEQQAALGKLRQAIRAAAPAAVEGVSYGLAAFRLNGKPLVAIGATSNHCAFYLMSNSTVGEHEELLTSYDTSPGTIRFEPGSPLPSALVKKLVKARIVENEQLIEARKPAKKTAKPSKAKSTTVNYDVAKVLAELKKLSAEKYRQGMERFAIPNDNALGVPVGEMRKLAKKIGRDHELSLELWKSKVYEARMMAAFVGEPEKVTAKQMESWCKTFDSWAIVDTVCFALFDRAPEAWTKVNEWATRKEEFVKRAAFALLASLVLHVKHLDDEHFAAGLQLIENAAEDERNFVKKGVNWALRTIGKRNKTLHAAAMAVAKKLGDSDNATARWIGKDAIRDLNSPATKRRLAK
ncbi:DNA alkylation repair protein [Anatilimnocola floriformis]|uniref:DNA alkylation repair protein n=1 Tax=Anatilimnocola floriformis TaxID=2948575 RepID=UPI0020C2039D|nr:DNA alkylation repair protein [Anatilimnocola floriformis]